MPFPFKSILVTGSLCKKGLIDNKTPSSNLKSGKIGVGILPPSFLSCSFNFSLVNDFADEGIVEFEFELSFVVFVFIFEVEVEVEGEED